MVIWALRGVFVLLGGSIGYSVAQLCRIDVLKGMLGGVVLAFVVIVLEFFFSRRPIASVSSIMFGLLVGFITARFFTEGLYLVLGPEAYRMLGTEIVMERDKTGTLVAKHHPAVPEDDFRNAVSLGMTCVFCYLGVTIFYQTRDRFRFIIPYVEFRPAEQGPTPMVLDTSVIIDGRIVDVIDTEFIGGPIIIPRFVLAELQAIADSADRHRRNRGRRGLSILDRLQRNPVLDVKVKEYYHGEDRPVDARLIDFAKTIDGRVVTTDFNLAKIAEIEGIRVLNLNDLAAAVKPTALPGDEITIELIKPGENEHQAVGYLDDGTMVVAEHAREFVGQQATLVVNRVLETTAGHMVFCRLKG